MHCYFSVVDGEKISFVDRSAVYKHHDEELEAENRSGEQDDYVLRRLLKKSGRNGNLFNSTFNFFAQSSYSVDNVISNICRAGV